MSASSVMDSAAERSEIIEDRRCAQTEQSGSVRSATYSASAHDDKAAAHRLALSRVEELEGLLRQRDAQLHSQRVEAEGSRRRINELATAVTSLRSRIDTMRQKTRRPQHCQAVQVTEADLDDCMGGSPLQTMRDLAVTATLRESQLLRRIAEQEEQCQKEASACLTLRERLREVEQHTAALQETVRKHEAFGHALSSLLTQSVSELPVPPPRTVANWCSGVDPILASMSMQAIRQTVAPNEVLTLVRQTLLFKDHDAHGVLCVDDSEPDINRGGSPLPSSPPARSNGMSLLERLAKTLSVESDHTQAPAHFATRTSGSVQQIEERIAALLRALADPKTASVLRRGLEEEVVQLRRVLTALMRRHASEMKSADRRSRPSEEALRRSVDDRHRTTVPPFDAAISPLFVMDDVG